MDDAPQDSQTDVQPQNATPAVTEDPVSSTETPTIQTKDGTVLTYEETPEIPLPTQTEVVQNPPRKSGKKFFVFLFFVAVVVAGMYLSGYVQQFLQGSDADTTTADEVITDTTGDATVPSTATDSANMYTGWTSYEVINGSSRLPIAGVSYKLPPDVLSPICDGQSCVSQGTYLPGGTRFTIAPRGTGQGLADFRGTVISDVNGTPFTTTDTTVAGRPAILFSGTFTGRTVSGYAFSAMHGVMVAITDTMSLEINHFAPSGITADFATDDGLFEKILSTFIFPTTGEKGAVMTSPTATLTPVPTKTATSSGY